MPSNLKESLVRVRAALYDYEHVSTYCSKNDIPDIKMNNEEMECVKISQNKPMSTKNVNLGWNQIKIEDEDDLEHPKLIMIIKNVNINKKAENKQPRKSIKRPISPIFKVRNRLDIKGKRSASLGKK